MKIKVEKDTIIRCCRCSHEWYPRYRYIDNEGRAEIKACPACRNPLLEGIHSFIVRSKVKNEEGEKWEKREK